MRVQVLLAHPLRESYCAAIAARAVKTLEARGYEVDFIDLYARGFDPRLTAEERARHYDGAYDTSAVADYVASLRAAQRLVFIFPQWWFNMPAILKGYFDRVWSPGVAFAHKPDGVGLVPLLTHIDKFWVVTTTGSPWWVAELAVRNPVRRQLKRGPAALCARRVAFRMLTHYGVDTSSDQDRVRFLKRVEAAFRTF